MTKEQRLELLKLIEEQIYVSSLESTFLDDSKSVAIHSIIEEETERLEQEPCEEYVSREAVEDAIAEYEIDGERIGYRVACDIVSELPSVTPQPKTGHWIDANGDNAICGCCNRLNHLYGTYCKHCGAKMEAQDDVD